MPGKHRDVEVHIHSFITSTLDDRSHEIQAQAALPERTAATTEQETGWVRKSV